MVQLGPCVGGGSVVQTLNRVAVVTAIYDGYDSLKPALVQEDADVDWVCVTDNPDLWDGYLGWRVVYKPQPGVHPNRAAKHPKLFPWDYTDAPTSIWVDAAFRVISPRFAAVALGYADPVAQFQHPWRDCVYTEADASLGLPKYAGEPVKEQAWTYRAQGHPEHWGLWATGVIARRHTDAVRRMSHVWRDEIDRWSFQDQVSEAVALRNCDLRPTAFPGWHMDNGWLRHEGSARH